MNEHSVGYCGGERTDSKGALQGHAFWHRFLLACMAVTFTVCSSLPGEAVNGEPVGGQGVHRTATCDTDFVISCDDRSQTGVVSCHMRRQPNVDEGLAVNVCFDGRITTAASQTLETGVTVSETDFGEFVCGKESNGVTDFCVVCDTFTDTSGGASNCVKIVNDGGGPGPSTCGAYNISRDDDGGLCLNAEQDLEQFFSDPHLGFSIGIDGDDAGDKAGTAMGEGKDLLVCSGRSWQCITDRSLPLATQAQQVQGQQTHALIDTPCCIRLASGSYYCSAKLTPSSTCK